MSSGGVGRKCFRISAEIDPRTMAANRHGDTQDQGNDNPQDQHRNDYIEHASLPSHPSRSIHSRSRHFNRNRHSPTSSPQAKIVITGSPCEIRVPGHGTSAIGLNPKGSLPDSSSNATSGAINARVA